MSRLLIAVSILIARDAIAQPNGAQAEVLFREAQRLLSDGKIVEACDAFDASQKLDPTIATVLNQADCREQNLQFATAWGLFLEVARTTRDSTEPRLQGFHKVARQHAAALEPRLSTLTLTVAPDAQVGGLEIRQSGHVVARATWNKAMPVDGGTYTISASAPGNAAWSATITIGNERDTKTIEIPILKAAALSRPQEKPIVTPRPPESRAPHVSRSPIYLGIGSLVVLGGALALELSARATYDDAKTNLDPARQLSLWDSANTRRYLAEGIALAGVAAGGVAVWMMVRNRRVEKRTQIAPLGLGLQIAGGF